MDVFHAHLFVYMPLVNLVVRICSINCSVVGVCATVALGHVETIVINCFQYCLSGDPNRPCFVLKFKQTSIMLDCGLDTSTLLQFLPTPLLPRYELVDIISEPLFYSTVLHVQKVQNTIFLRACSSHIPP